MTLSQFHIQQDIESFKALVDILSFSRYPIFAHAQPVSMYVHTRIHLCIDMHEILLLLLLALMVTLTHALNLLHMDT